MTEKTRKNYTVEFKREAVRLVTDEGYKAAEAARSLGINGNMLGRWVRDSRDESESAFPGKGNLNAEQQEISRLREENKRLRLEKEILKKRRPSSPRRGTEVPVHYGGEGELSSNVTVPGNGSQS